MPKTDWSKLKEIVADALEAPPATRVEFIEKACGGDVALKTEALALVEASDEATGVIDSRTDALLGLGGPDLLGLQGMRIGRYQLEGLIAEGAMAAVYKARQIGLNRSVALKLFRTSLPLIDAKTRFKREAQALAKLRHPNIAQIFEAGSHQTDQRNANDPSARAMPYIAMELVDGGPLTRFAAQKELSVRQRVELMIEVALAVHAAHQQAIIHCDLKPGNVLVDNGTGQAKVLDFGIARFISDDSSTWQTTAGVLLGTPGYMSPEQASGSNREVDVRSDVYALGVMLFELLSGEMPLELRGLTIHETLHEISTGEPRKLRDFVPELSGDLETICCTAMERDKARRYTSAQAFVDDLQRYLKDEPILARPASTVYVMRKFARRHRGPIAAAAAMLALLVAGVIVSTIGFVNAEQAKKVAQHERDSADAERANAQRERDAADEQRGIAQTERDDANQQRTIANEQRDRAESERGRASAVNAFLTELLQSPDPRISKHDVTILSAIQRMEPSISTRFAGSPEAEADVRTAVGQTLFELNQPAAAHEQFARAAAIYEKTTGPISDQTMDATTLLAESLRWVGKPQAALDMADAKLKVALPKLGPDAPRILNLQGTRAGSLSDLERFKEAETAYQDVIERWSSRAGGSRSPASLVARCNLANTFLSDNNLIAARDGFLSVIADEEIVHGAASAQVLTPRYNLAETYYWMKEYDRCLEIIERVLPQARNQYGDDGDIVLKCLKLRSTILRDRGRYEEALKDVAECAVSSERTRGPLAAGTLAAETDRVMLLSSLDRNEEALKILDRTLGRVNGSPDTDPYKMKQLVLKGRVLIALGRAQEAMPILVDSVKFQTQAFGKDDPRVIYAQSVLGLAMAEAGHPAEAEPVLRNAVEAFGPQPSEGWALSKVCLVRCLVRLQKWEDAARESEQAWTFFDGASDTRMAFLAARRMAQAYADAGRETEAKAWQERAAGKSPQQRITSPSPEPTTQPATP